MELLEKIIEDSNLDFSFNNKPLFKNFNLKITGGLLTAILWDSGKGKTTLLRLISGLETPAKGNIILDNRVLFGPSINVDTSIREVGLVFQDYSLFPHMSVVKTLRMVLSKITKKQKKKSLTNY